MSEHDELNDGGATIDIAGPAFASRLANLLVERRTELRQSQRSMARSSQGRFSRSDLIAFEQAERTLDESTIDELVQLYGCDLDSILPSRLPITITERYIATGGVRQEFEAASPDAILIAYLTLVRTLRRQTKAPVVEVRRSDVEVLAGFLAMPDEVVVHRLASLMNVTQMKRTAMVGVLLTGAAVIGLVGSAVAMSSGTDTGSRPTAGGVTGSAVSVVTTAPVTAPITTPVTTPAAPITSTTVVTKPITRVTVPTPVTNPVVTVPFVDTNLAPVDEVTVIAVDEPPVPTFAP